MEGNWDQKDFRYFKINFDICNSSTSKSCGTNEEIKKALDGGVFSLSMFNSMTNLKVKGNPFSQ